MLKISMFGDLEFNMFVSETKLIIKVFLFKRNKVVLIIFHGAFLCFLTLLLKIVTMYAS